MNYLKRNLNIKNINIKHFRITNRFLPPGNQGNKTRTIVKPKQVIQINAAFPIYVLHSLHGQLLGVHFLVAALKALTIFKSLNTDGTNCRMSGPRYLLLACP